MSVEWTKQNILPARDVAENGSVIVPFLRDMKFLWAAVEDRGGTDAYDANVTLRARNAARNILSRWNDGRHPFVVPTDEIVSKWDVSMYWLPRLLKNHETASTDRSKFSDGKPLLLDSARRMFYDVKRMRRFCWDAAFDEMTLHTTETSGGDSPPTPTVGNPYFYNMGFIVGRQSGVNRAWWVKSVPSSGSYTVNGVPSHAGQRDRIAYLVMQVFATGTYTDYDESPDPHEVISLGTACAIPVEASSDWSIPSSQVSLAVSSIRSHYGLIEPTSSADLAGHQVNDGSGGYTVSFDIAEIVPVPFIDEATDIWDIGWDWTPTANGGGGN